MLTFLVKEINFSLGEWEVRQGELVVLVSIFTSFSFSLLFMRHFNPGLSFIIGSLHRQNVASSDVLVKQGISHFVADLCRDSHQDVLQVHDTVM